MTAWCNLEKLNRTVSIHANRFDKGYLLISHIHLVNREVDIYHGILIGRPVMKVHGIHTLHATNEEG